MSRRNNQKGTSKNQKSIPNNQINTPNNQESISGNQITTQIKDAEKMPIFFILSKEDIEEIEWAVVKGGNKLPERLDDILKIRSIKSADDATEYIYMDDSGSLIGSLYPHGRSCVVTCTNGKHHRTNGRAVFKVDVDEEKEAIFIALIAAFKEHYDGETEKEAYREAYTSQKPFGWEIKLGGKKSKSDNENLELEGKKYIAVELSGDYIPLVSYLESAKLPFTAENIFSILMDKVKYQFYDNKDNVETKINSCHEIAEYSKVAEPIFNELIKISSQEDLDKYFREIFREFTPDDRCCVYEYFDKKWEYTPFQIKKRIAYLCWQDLNREALDSEKSSIYEMIMNSTSEKLLSEFREIREKGLKENKSSSSYYSLYNDVFQIVKKAKEKNFEAGAESYFYEILETKVKYWESDQKQPLISQLIEFLTKQGFIIRKEGDLISSLCAIACIASDEQVENLSKCYSEISRAYNPEKDSSSMEIVENLPEHKQAVSVEQKTVESATKEEPAHKVLLGGTPKEISLLNKLVDRQRT